MPAVGAAVLASHGMAWLAVRPLSRHDARDHQVVDVGPLNHLGQGEGPTVPQRLLRLEHSAPSEDLLVTLLSDGDAVLVAHGHDPQAKPVVLAGDRAAGGGKEGAWDATAKGLAPMPKARVAELVKPIAEVGGRSPDYVAGPEEEVAPLRAVWKMQPLVREVALGLVDRPAIVDQPLPATSVWDGEATSLEEVPSVRVARENVLLHQNAHLRAQEDFQKLLLVFNADAMAGADADLWHLLIWKYDLVEVLKDLSSLRRHDLCPSEQASSIRKTDTGEVHILGDLHQRGISLAGRLVIYTCRLSCSSHRNCQPGSSPPR